MTFCRFLKNLTKFRNISTAMTKNKTKPLSQNAPSPSPNLKPPEAPAAESAFEVLANPVKSFSDKKEYKVIRLKNGLTVCLVSDKTPIDLSDDESDDDEYVTESESDEDSTDHTDPEDDDNGKKNLLPEQKMAAAALCIGVGSFSDPKEVPGMAHFLEHMVFMGSEKYPEENDFDSFISKRGGSDNASTDCEVTTFYFECLEKHLMTALDKFAQFFISPLMKRGSITREREAIESEFQMALPSDTYRKEQLLMSFAKADCPVNGFTWGNLITLRDNVDEDKLYEGVHEFRKRHYSAHRMTLAIQARLPIDTLEAYVLDYFAAVPCNSLPPDDFSTFNNVFDTPAFTRMYYIEPTHNVTQVDLTWALPSLLDKYKSKPHQYISWLLGDEGKGSLLSYLRKKVWVLSMSTGNGESGSEHNSMYALFTISMSLTDDGLSHLNEVIEAIFSYINKLKELGPQERIYNEIKTIEDTSFRFQIEEAAVDSVEELAENMHFFPPEHYLSGSELYFEYDPVAITTILESLTPERMNILIFNKTLPPGFSFDKTEKWFNTKYTDHEISNDLIEKWGKAKPLAEFSVPPPNQFLTQDFAILPEELIHLDYPQKIVSSNKMELWYRKDEKFKLPTAFYYFYLIHPPSLQSALGTCKMDVFVNLLQIALIEETYPAVVAELSYSFKTGDKGIILKVSGYNEKLHALIELITRYFGKFNECLTEDMFEAVKDRLLKQYFNSTLKPGTVAKDVRLQLLLNNYHTSVDKYNEISSVTFDGIKQYAKDFIGALYVKCLVQGNVGKETAIEVIETFMNTLDYNAIEAETYPKFRVTQVPKGETVCRVKSFNKNDANSIITNYYQSGLFSVKNSVIIEIIMLIIQEPLFDALRTKEQLGYHVYCSLRETYGISGLTITVNAQATKHTTQHVDARIEEFVKQAAEILNKLSSKSFEETKKDFIKMKQCTDVHLKEEVSRNWSEIVDDDYMFDRLRQEVRAAEQLKVNEVKKWWKAHSACGNLSDFRKLSIQIVGFDTSEENTVPEVDNKLLGAPLSLSFLDKTQPEDRQVFVKSVNSFKRYVDLFPEASKCPL